MQSLVNLAEWLRRETWNLMGWPAQVRTLQLTLLFNFRLIVLISQASLRLDLCSFTQLPSSFVETRIRRLSISLLKKMKIHEVIEVPFLSTKCCFDYAKHRNFVFVAWVLTDRFVLCVLFTFPKPRVWLDQSVYKDFVKSFSFVKDVLMMSRFFG